MDHQGVQQALFELHQAMGIWGYVTAYLVVSYIIGFFFIREDLKHKAPVSDEELFAGFGLLVISPVIVTAFVLFMPPILLVYGFMRLVVTFGIKKEG